MKHVYEQKSYRELNNNDSKRYLPKAHHKKDIIPNLMKLDKYFCSTRKFVMDKYNMGKGSMASKPSLQVLSSQTSNPLNVYRSLENERDKKEVLQSIHRDSIFKQKAEKR